MYEKLSEEEMRNMSSDELMRMCDERETSSKLNRFLRENANEKGSFRNLKVLCNIDFDGKSPIYILYSFCVPIFF